MTAVKRLMTGKASLKDTLTVTEYKELTNNAPEGILAGKDSWQIFENDTDRVVQVLLMNPTFLNGNATSLDPKEHLLKAAYSLQHYLFRKYVTKT
jgi:hypothetical protein